MIPPSLTIVGPSLYAKHSACLSRYVSIIASLSDFTKRSSLAGDCDHIEDRSFHALRYVRSILAAAVDKPDLPTVMRVGKRQIGTLRIGAFAPQYDPVFTAAAEAVETSSAGSEETDAPMLAGFCAVTQKLIERYDALSSKTDFILIDLRGNMGGFAREVRGFAWALTGKKPEKTYDMVVSGQPGTVRLQELPEDPSCGVVRTPKPLLVLIDAGTRSSGELLATYLWESGATVVGERTIGAGGGRDSQSKGIPVGDSGYNALVSEDFYVFDPTSELHPGEIDEQRLIDRVAADRFAPSHLRPYMTQAVGVLPDIVQLIEASDLEDGGQRLVERSIAGMRPAL
ncbi:hypothetical protein XcyCFBP4188_19080 [Xanthomonas hortorum pv. cynarae]|nr:hypothetical protein XcyCFBP4188_19080 [Xanthomonas hortorum pv. cynarae]